ncbi:MAG: hydrophobe/amphiphile efflux-1 family RND transporter [Bacteroidetes bacterium 24-39-8]|jgi:HAE1 family hydrophobic/amphiphilic exporter-1|nr:MAG: hydrophobe/amphiphile efflux-1 family RND transporter [Sphingobacteriia bacterium 35-40-8]OYZ52712.1 MAG: hydrophobe/amphiphile efflux-1 family RND transporter [Bacteroidetes bacterium 24-39-8]OZA62382.1 MAG: hydrophobe/amphiphile efflux-1 family RND transporter [Sphingobacteriia bacterium 39-39-8]HQR91735.1 multidrug efflux RND transporter permease subunit [Sediminibacterium sp.]HQS54412.1 multidrug efflux RND transporter permease subunit [Sediminibacterium sp.]
MSEFFIRRPIVAMVISIFIVIMGLLTLQGIPVAKYPDITPPMVQVQASYTGANAVDMEQTVATPIEQQVNGVENMLYMKSVNYNGSMTLQVSFEVGTDLDVANMLTQNRVSRANPFLPPEVINLGVNVKKSLTFPLMMFSVYSPSKSYNADFINNYAFINLIDELKRIKGVGDVSVMGSSEYAMRIWVKPDRLAKLKITASDVMNAIKAQNNIVPGGAFGDAPSKPGVQNTYTATLQQRLVSEEDFGNILLKSNANGAQVRLKDVARIELGLQMYNLSSNLNGSPCAAIAIYQIPGSNGLDVANKAKAKMDELKSRFPQGLDYTTSLDTTQAITVGIEEVLHTLFEAVILVILVVFLFLQDWRATLIPLLTVPVSLIGTFIVFPLLGFSVNQLSLLGMVLAIGLVVDDAIVVVEAVIHEMEHGLNPKEATSKAMKEVGGPVVAIAVILCAVFIPVALSGGITGRLYQQFAITIAISVALSAFNALTLSPALAAILLKPKKPSKGLLQRFFDGFNKYFDKFTNGYVKVASFAARRLFLTVMILLGICVATGYLAFKVPGGFVPEEDEGYFMLAIQLPDAASKDRTEVISKKVESYFKGMEEISSYTAINGFNILSGTATPNSAMAFISLKPWDERHKTVAQIVNEMNGVLAKNITEATVIVFGPPPIQGLGSGAGFTMMLQDKAGKSPLYLAQQTQRFIAIASKRPEIGKIYTLFRPIVPQKSIQVDKEKVQKMGIPLQEVNGAISAYLGGAFINNFNAYGRQYRAYIQSEAEYRTKPDDINQYFVRDPNGNMVSLGTLAKVKDTTGPSFTNHFNIYRAAELSGVPAPGVSSDMALRVLEGVAKKVLPNDIGYSWSNTSYQEKESAGKGASVFIMALLFVFLILAAQYESWKLPFSVLLGTPWAVMGALLGLFIGGFYATTYVNNVFAQIGLVMLIGLNAKNAILIVEFAKMKMDNEGLPPFEAAIEGARLRFRPILMTSFAFILGVVPLMTATGAGAEARRVMGTSVFSGMLVATIVGVILIPAFFVLIEGKKKKKASVAPATVTNHSTH